MALDRPRGDAVDGPNEERPAYAARTELAEPRSRAEYYDALQGEPLQGPDGWDTVDTRDRPPLEAFRVSPERQAHILDGDATGGGHRHGTGSPGKTEFPASWDDEKAVRNILDAARQPSEGHIMTEPEIIERAEALPERFTDRLNESTLWSIRRMRGGGEYGELTIELTAALAANGAPVTPVERDELRALLEAMGMPTDPVEKLNVQG